MMSDYEDGPGGGWQIVPVTVGGAKIFIEAQGASGEQTIAGIADLPQKFSNVAEGIGELSSSMLAALKAAAPTALEVEFGIDLKVEPDGLFALLVKGEASASLKVTVKWEGNDAKP